MHKLPYLTADLPGIGGEFKTYPEDFYVEEIPKYEASGEGQHTYLKFEKIGLTTLSAINRIAQSLGVSARKIGYAGLKDAQAVTQQTISIDGVSPEQVLALRISGIRPISVSKHRNKLKVGHLAGNRFVIRIRDVSESVTPQVDFILGQLGQMGVPNYFGQQRFGLRENSQRLGLALMKRDSTAFFSEFLGQPHPDEMPMAQRARAAFDAGQLDEALALWPKSLNNEWRVLRQLVQSGDHDQALRRLDRRLMRLFVSAYQSYLFNQLLSQRLDNIARLELGDAAYIHRSGATFIVEDLGAEQARADAFEISASGPLFGPKYLPAEGEPNQREQAILRQANVSLQDFNASGVRLSGGRRPYRIPLKDISMHWDDGVVVSFSLPPGAYATMVLREIMKVS